MGSQADTLYYQTYPGSVGVSIWRKVPNTNGGVNLEHVKTITKAALALSKGSIIASDGWDLRRYKLEPLDVHP